MTYNMNLESKRQELARRMVNEHVCCCVSGLVSELSSFVQSAPHATDISWEEDILPLLERIDYEEAVRQFINDCTDADEIRDLIENDGYFDDFVTEEVQPKFKRKPDHPDTLCIDCHMTIQTGERDPDTSEERDAEIDEAVSAYDASAVYCGEEFDDEFSVSRCDCCGSTLYGARFMYQEPDNMEEEDLQSWLDDDDHPERWPAFREAVFEFLQQNSDFRELCSEFNIDTDDYRNEVYEHWAISGWLEARLQSYGEVTGDLCGLTIWGRCCTGQSMALDYSIQQIACVLYNDEWKEFCYTLTKSEGADV